MKTLRENYTSVCWYCGVIFKHNKWRGQYCCSQHRPLYAKYGSRINPLIPDASGKLYNAELRLQAAYNYDKGNERLTPDGWSLGMGKAILPIDFGYRGPYPDEGEILVVGGFLMERHAYWEAGIVKYQDFLKPFTLLTQEEKATRVFVGVAEVWEREQKRQKLN